jgi:hypothetical protein
MMMKETMIMGKFRTSEFHRVAGIYEPVESVVEYTYCDKCGSFNIDIGYPKRPFDNTLAIVIPVSYVVAIVTGLLTHSLAACGEIGMIGLIAFLIYIWGKHAKCNTCGNENITSNNVLNYPSADMSIDVPEESIIKHFIQTIIR